MHALSLSVAIATVYAAAVLAVPLDAPVPVPTLPVDPSVAVKMATDDNTKFWAQCVAPYVNDFSKLATITVVANLNEQSIKLTEGVDAIKACAVAYQADLQKDLDWGTTNGMNLKDETVQKLKALIDATGREVTATFDKISTCANTIASNVGAANAATINLWRTTAMTVLRPVFHP
ncbi:uncharacterized protein AB675_9696 [Cyphellophora attinorum]|uniref:Cell wall mannoprotein 1 n=1 Tax=Cyphellophora attinorum TaxID=1664694 RepID=A0A0N1HDB4_9EURO|nr:uncharacterized protein AB675_9696 [Phialophora attinorum]KPI42304.1 hypothetical protein AB675_9696 [Phialophora attinorum]